nr:hypothetical protein [Tanacetum cinerariifolium]
MVHNFVLPNNWWGFDSDLAYKTAMVKVDEKEEK